MSHYTLKRKNDALGGNLSLLMPYVDAFLAIFHPVLFRNLPIEKAGSFPQGSTYSRELNSESSI